MMVDRRFIAADILDKVAERYYGKQHKEENRKTVQE